jgi:HAD superfamily hydrolase (TIGR01458 family)
MSTRVGALVRDDHCVYCNAQSRLPHASARKREEAVIKAVLLDVGGVVYVGDQALAGATEAVGRLQAAGLRLRYITNTTRTPQGRFLAKLRGLGLQVAPEEVFMPALAARALLAAQELTPLLLVHPALEEDFAGLPPGRAEAVVVGDAGEGFTYQSLNRAFRALAGGAAFLALAKNRSFQDDDGALSLDAGPFVTALEYATGREALVLGKPSAAFFRSALGSLGCGPREAVMIGDDCEADIGGAQAIGVPGVLVRSGKYRQGDEARIDPPPGAVVANLPAAVDWVLSRKNQS